LHLPKTVSRSYALAPSIESSFCFFATLADAECTVNAKPLTLIASGAVAAFWSFFAAEKGKAPAAMSGIKI